MQEIPDLPDTDYCCYADSDIGCLCGESERALRAWKAGKLTQPMTPDQRDWALNEIASVEGYERHDYENSRDNVLAGAVLSAWVDYCRDKGQM